MSEDKEKEEGAIVLKEPELIAPASIEKTLDALKRFEEFKRRVLTEDDYVTMSIKNEKRKYIKKSGWLKYALACSISLEKREEREEIRDDGTRVYHYTYRAIAPSGRFADAVGSASSDERDFAHEIHDVRALAQTRAMERAISNLIGGGELGAEEILPTKEAEVKEDVKPPPKEVEGWKEKMAGKLKPETTATTTKAEVTTTATVAKAEPKKILEAPPGAKFITSHGKPYGYIKAGEGSADLYFDPPLDLNNPDVARLVESFLYGRVLDQIKKTREEKGLFFSYTPIVENNQLQGISFAADPEALDDATIREISSSAGWTAARAAEKVG
jgi:hypothetical protein